MPLTPRQLEMRQRWRDKNRDRINAEMREWRARNKDKTKHYRLKHGYGITLDQYQEMLLAQGGVCAVCGRGPKKKTLCVDHNHETGTVRGLLCGDCNFALGLLGDDPSRIDQLSRYARAHLGR